MIIKHPTALYKSVIPGPEDGGNISYTISNNDPPRSNQTFLQLPPEEEYRPSNPLVIPKDKRRGFLGDLYSEIVVPGKSDQNTGNIQFEIGQVLEFTDSEVSSVDSYSLSSVDLIQNNSVVDYAKFGLSEDEIEEIQQEAQKQFDSINTEIAIVGKNININQGKITDNQADINSITKLINSTVKVLGETNASVIKLKAKLDELNAANAELIAENAELQTTLNELRDSLNTVKEVVR